METLVFRVVQEALTNVAKHAQAPPPSGSTSVARERLSLKVEDGGARLRRRRVPASTDEDRGFGLRGMRDRVHLFAGRFALRSAPGAGTTLEIEVPLEATGGAGLMARLRVLLADDHTIVRQGLVSILKAGDEFDVVAEAADGSEAVEQALETRPDVVVLDISMPRLNGLEAARRIHKALPRRRILVLTMHDDEEYVLKMVRAGASGYLVKDGAASELVAAIRALKRGPGVLRAPGRQGPRRGLPGGRRRSRRIPTRV